MADDLERLVRESLDAVDRSRRFGALAIAALFLIFVFTLGFLLAHAPIGSAGEAADPNAGPHLAKLLWVTIAAQMAFLALCVALLAGHVTRMTKAVLRAIELSRK